MKRHEGERIINVIKELMSEDTSAAQAKRGDTPAAVPPAGSPGGKLRIDLDNLEAIYAQIKTRLLDELRVDPILLALVAQRPEIILEIEPVRVELDAKTLKGRAARLIAAGWMKTAKATSAIRRELARTGADPGGGGTLSDKLSELQRDGFLTREGEGWVEAPGIKITEKILER